MFGRRVISMGLLAVAIFSPAAKGLADSSPDGGFVVDGTASLGRCSPTDVQTQIADLDNADPQIRQRAREMLMTLGIGQLPMLEQTIRQAVDSGSSLSPTQVMLLKDIVCQIAVVPMRDAAAI